MYFSFVSNFLDIANWACFSAFFLSVNLKRLSSRPCMKILAVTFNIAEYFLADVHVDLCISGDVPPLRMKIRQLVEVSGCNDRARVDTCAGQPDVSVHLSNKLRTVGVISAGFPTRFDFVRLRKVVTARAPNDIGMPLIYPFEADNPPIIFDICQDVLNQPVGYTGSRDRIDTDEVSMDQCHMAGLSVHVEGFLGRCQKLRALSRTCH